MMRKTYKTEQQEMAEFEEMMTNAIRQAVREEVKQAVREEVKTAMAEALNQTQTTKSEYATSNGNSYTSTYDPYGGTTFV